MKKITVKDILSKKKNGEKIAVLTAYDAIFARLADAAGADIILVGDSVGNTFLGFESTVNVTADMMLHHTAAVARAKPNALIVADIPFAQASLPFDNLLKLCMALLQNAGAEAVKIEGGEAFKEKIAALAAAGVPVMGHIGLLPQQVLKLGGYRGYGKTDAERLSLIKDAKALEEAGVFAMVLEMVDSAAAKEISASVNVPTIGIGAGKDCDGQVLVCTDVLGLSAFTPKFAKRYADCADAAKNAFASYVKEVKGGKFPQS